MHEFWPVKRGKHDFDLKSIYERAVNDVVVFTFNAKLDEATSALRVTFQFGSEEYPDFVGTIYNDAFGFFVSGPNLDETKNMAVIPFSGDVTSVNTINVGQFGANAEQGNPVVFKNAPFYINNGHSTSYNPVEGKLNHNTNDQAHLKNVFVEYNGLTKLLTYDLVDLVPGGEYTFKVAIADSGDTDYDSGVMIHKIYGTTGSDLSIVKEIDNSEPNVGDIVEFTLTATNNGPYLAEHIVVEDKLPKGYEFISSETSKDHGFYNKSKGIWEISKLNVGWDLAVLKIKARVNAKGDYTNKASITVKEPKKYPDAFLENNYSEVTPDVQKPAGIDLVKIGKVDDTVDGDYGNGVINYTFKITNIGDVPLKDIRLEDTKLPVGTVYNYTGDTNGNGLLDTDEFWTGTATYHITDADTDAEKVENRATVFGMSPKGKLVSADSKDEAGLDKATVTKVEGGGPLMTNPHIYHKVQ